VFLRLHRGGGERRADEEAADEDDGGERADAETQPSTGIVLSGAERVERHRDGAFVPAPNDSRAT
jgi:hypothetical protein